MKDVRNLQAGLVAIYPPAAFPVAKVTAGSRAEAVVNTFAFGAAEMSPVGEAIFQRGRMLTEDEEIVIPSLRFDDRRVLLTVAGTSAQADLVVNALEDIFFSGEARLEPIVVVYEASCTAVLDIDWQALFNSSLANFIETRLRSEARTHGIEPRIAIAGLAINLAYETPADLAEHSISLSPKNFSIGLAPKTPPSERRFVSASPMRTEDHLSLLESLEVLLASSATRTRK